MRRSIFQSAHPCSLHSRQLRYFQSFQLEQLHLTARHPLTHRHEEGLHKRMHNKQPAEQDGQY